MKILSLNTWRGAVRPALDTFIQTHAGGIDVFCFQEAEKDFLDACIPLTESYHLVSAEKIQGTMRCCQKIFVKKEFPILESGDIDKEDERTGYALWVSIMTENGPLYICNVHGNARPGDKLDTPERLSFSKKIIDHAHTCVEPKIIIGDFNLEKCTKSVELFTQNGFCNLIETYNIVTTRNHYAWDKHPTEKQYYADYAFVKDLSVKRFEVLPDEVSDHQALLIEVK